MPKDKKRKVSRKDRDNIKKAAQSLPELLFGQPDPESPHEHQDHIHDDKTLGHIQGKKKTLVVGIAAMMACIIVLWFVNMQTLVYDVTHAESREGQLLDQIGEEYQDAINLTRLNAQNAEDQIELRLADINKEQIIPLDEDLSQLIQKVQASVPDAEQEDVKVRVKVIDPNEAP